MGETFIRHPFATLRGRRLSWCYNQIMLPLDTENIVFVSKVIRVTVRVTMADKPEGDAEVSVFDIDGSDITDKVLSLTLTRQLGSRFDYATLELNMPGFDGPFCTPAVDFL